MIELEFKCYGVRRHLMLRQRLEYFGICCVSSSEMSPIWHQNGVFCLVVVHPKLIRVLLCITLCFSVYRLCLWSKVNIDKDYNKFNRKRKKRNKLNKPIKCVFFCKEIVREMQLHFLRNLFMGNCCFVDCVSYEQIASCFVCSSHMFDKLEASTNN